jgi:hypothetical protein
MDDPNYTQSGDLDLSGLVEPFEANDANRERAIQFLEQLSPDGSNMVYLSRSDTTVGILLLDKMLTNETFSSLLSEEGKEKLLRDSDLEPDSLNELMKRQMQSWDTKLPDVINEAISMLFWESLADGIDALRVDRDLNPLDRHGFTEKMGAALTHRLKKRQPPILYAEPESNLPS